MLLRPSGGSLPATAFWGGWSSPLRGREIGGFGLSRLALSRMLLVTFGRQPPRHGLLGWLVFPASWKRNWRFRAVASGLVTDAASPFGRQPPRHGLLGWLVFPASWKRNWRFRAVASGLVTDAASPFGRQPPRHGLLGWLVFPTSWKRNWRFRAVASGLVTDATRDLRAAPSASRPLLLGDKVAGNGVSG